MHSSTTKNGNMIKVRGGGGDGGGGGGGGGVPKNWPTRSREKRMENTRAGPKRRGGNAFYLA